METPLELTFRNMNHSEHLEELVREKVARLEHFSDQITSCHVAIEAPHKHQTKGRHYEVRIEVRVPGTELAISHHPGDTNAIRDAFSAMERKLKKWKET